MTLRKYDMMEGPEAGSHGQYAAGTHLSNKQTPAGGPGGAGGSRGAPLQP